VTAGSNFVMSTGDHSAVAATDAVFAYEMIQ
jgi:hypothetical protein